MDEHDEIPHAKFQRLLLRRITTLGLVLVLWAALQGIGIYFLRSSLDSNTEELREVSKRLEQFPPGSSGGGYDEYD